MHISSRYWEVHTLKEQIAFTNVHISYKKIIPIWFPCSVLVRKNNQFKIINCQQTHFGVTNSAPLQPPCGDELR